MFDQSVIQLVVIGLLACILAALVGPRLVVWWLTRRYMRAADRQEKFLEEYDVCAVSPADYERFLLGILGPDDPKAFLMNRKALRLAKSLYPTKAKTAADRQAAWDQEEDRRRRLGLPTQQEARDLKVVGRYYKPHYEHLKAGIKVPSCLLCDLNNEEMDRSHLEIWGRAEREEEEERAKYNAALALFGFKELPPPKTIRCEEAELLYAKLKSKYSELHGAATDYADKGRIIDGHSLVLGKINAARACGKYGPCTKHVPRAGNAA